MLKCWQTVTARQQGQIHSCLLSKLHCSQCKFFYVTLLSFFWSYYHLQHFKNYREAQMPLVNYVALIPKLLQFRWSLCALAGRSHFILLIWKSSYQCSGVHAPSDCFFFFFLYTWKDERKRMESTGFYFTSLTSAFSSQIKPHGARAKYCFNRTVALTFRSLTFFKQTFHAQHGAPSSWSN